MSNRKAIPREKVLYVRDHCLCLATQRAARVLARRFDAALRPLGITNWQFSLLMSLNRTEPASMSSVVALLGLDRTTLTSNLKPLERRGLVSMTVDPADRRGRRLSLTSAGRKLLLAALPIWESTHEDVDKILTPGAADAVRAALRTLS